MEAVCAKGFLMQLLTEHRRVEGHNPSVVTRDQLIEEGVPIIANHEALSSSSSRQCGAFILFKNAEDLARKRRGQKLDRKAYLDWVDALRDRWYSADEDTRAYWLEKARSDNVDKEADVEKQDDERVDESEEDADRSPFDYCSRNVVKAMGNKREPIETSFFESSVKNLMGVDPDSPLPGFRRYAAALRNRQLSELFQGDDDAIPADRVYGYELTCGIAHPGLCATDDAGIIHEAREAASSLRGCLSKSRVGSCHCLFSMTQDGDDIEFVHFSLAHFRGSGPRIALLSPATLREDYVLVADWDEHGDLRWDVDVSVCGKMFKTATSVDILLCHVQLRTDDDCFFRRWFHAAGGPATLRFPRVIDGGRSSHFLPRPGKRSGPSQRRAQVHRQGYARLGGGPTAASRSQDRYSSSNAAGAWRHRWRWDGWQRHRRRLQRGVRRAQPCCRAERVRERRSGGAWRTSSSTAREGASLGVSAWPVVD